MNRYIVFILLLIIYGCNSTSDDFTGKEVVIPQSLKTKTFDIDTICSGFIDRDVKIVTYINSDECTPCKLNDIIFWFEIIEYFKQYGDRAVVLIIVYPDKNEVRETEVAFMQRNFSHPVFYDLNGDFERNNPDLPKDSKFHTFLLDRQNRVVLAGNPVQNPQLWERYKTEIKKLIDK